MTTEARVLDQLKECLIQLDKDCVLKLVKEALEQGISASRIVIEAMSRAMEEIGKLFEEGEYFIAELLEAADIFKEAMKILEPVLEKESRDMGVVTERIKVVIGTVKGDIHDIGKNLVAIMLRAAGFEVIDLGVDVSADTFVEAVKKYNADVVGMSALLTTTREYMREVIEALRREGLRDRVVVVIGGAATTPDFAKEIGADGWAPNAVEAVRLVKDLVHKKLKK